MEGWKKVPDVLLLHIYSYLSFKDKISASATCKHWRELFFHPVNWSHISFSYLKHDKSRENFLKSMISHFLSSCSIFVPVDTELTRNCDGCNQGYFSSQNNSLDFDLESLLHNLCHNKNINQLTIVQSRAEQLKVQPIEPQPAASVSALNHNGSQNCFCYDQNVPTEPSAAVSVGIVTRSMSKAKSKSQTEARKKVRIGKAQPQIELSQLQNKCLCDRNFVSAKITSLGIELNRQDSSCCKQPLDMIYTKSNTSYPPVAFHRNSTVANDRKASIKFCANFSKDESAPNLQ